MQDLKELNNRLAKYVDQGLYPGFQWQINIGDKVKYIPFSSFDL